MLAYRARYVFPIDQPPLRDGVVAIDHDRIVAVGETSSPAIHDLLPGARDLGNVAILPGLVNPHTHLEFSDLRQPLGEPGMLFPEWIRLVVGHRKASNDHQDGRALLRRITAGLTESTQYGVTALGEIATTPWGQHAPLEVEITQFTELIGLRGGAWERMIPLLNAIASRHSGPGEVSEKVSQLLLAIGSWNSEIFRSGISPHAPYSVNQALLKECVSVSGLLRIPVAHHLAESLEEIELLRTRSGPFVPLLKELEAWDPEAIPFGSRPLDYLKLLADSHRALVIHGNHLDDEEIGFLGDHADKMSVVYCPRTHAYFQHDPYPLSKMLTSGVNVAIGTDSRASNPDLSVLADMRFAAQQHPLAPPSTLLRMITINAAKALGRDDEIGSITAGKFADLAILKVPSHDAADPHDLLLDPNSFVSATIFRARKVFGDPFHE